MATIPSHEFDILSRVIMPDEPKLPREAAEGILRLSFTAADEARMRELLAKAKEGELSPSEIAEIEGYERVSSLLGILKSNARRMLRASGEESP